VQRGLTEIIFMRLQALEAFLDARRAYVAGALQAAAAAGQLPAEELAAALADAAGQLQEAVCAAGQLCMHGPAGTDTQPLLPPRVAGDGLGSAEMLFGLSPPEEVRGSLLAPDDVMRVELGCKNQQR
jgi:hypothetical protein